MSVQAALCAGVFSHVETIAATNEAIFSGHSTQDGPDGLVLLHCKLGGMGRLDCMTRSKSHEASERAVAAVKALLS